MTAALVCLGVRKNPMFGEVPEHGAQGKDPPQLARGEWDVG
jgi:hypothetical protein